MGFNFEKKKRDFVMIFATRMMRMFSYGLLALVFLDNLLSKGFSSDQASWIQSSIVFGDICISLILTTHADRFGRINSLMLGSLLRLITGFVYAESSNVILITISGILGVISVSGGEIGPFMAIEQSALAQLVEECSDEPEHIPSNVSAVFGYYNMAGNLSQAAGAALAGIYINASVNSFSTTKN